MDGKGAICIRHSIHDSESAGKGDTTFNIELKVHCSKARILGTLFLVVISKVIGILN